MTTFKEEIRMKSLLRFFLWKFKMEPQNGKLQRKNLNENSFVNPSLEGKNGTETALFF